MKSRLLFCVNAYYMYSYVIHVHMSICLSLTLHMCTYMLKAEANIKCLPPLLSTTFSETGSVSEPEFTNLARLACW